MNIIPPNTYALTTALLSFPKTEDVFSFIEQIKTIQTVSVYHLAPQLAERFTLTEAEAERYLTLCLIQLSQKFLRAE